MVARRVSLLILLLLVVFAAVDLLPGSAARVALGRDASATEVSDKASELGLDDPVYVRFLDWATGLVTGDFGTSTRGEPIADLIGSRMPNSVVLAVLALLLTVAISLTAGSYWMLRPQGIVAKALGPLTTMMIAVPEFVFATLLVLVFSLWLGLFPAVTITNLAGAPAGWDMLVLPVLSLALPMGAWNIRVVRAALDEAASYPHVEAALLDGLPRLRVLMRHVLPIAVPTIAASIGTTTGMLFGGALVVETIFNYPGIGSLLAGSVGNRDTNLAATLVALTAIAIMLILLVADGIRGWSTRGRS